MQKKKKTLVMSRKLRQIKMTKTYAIAGEYSLPKLLFAD